MGQRVEKTVTLFITLFSWRRKWQHTPVLLPGEFYGQRSLVGYSPRGRKESDTTERLHSLTYSLTLSENKKDICSDHSFSKSIIINFQRKSLLCMENNIQNHLQPLPYITIIFWQDNAILALMWTFHSISCRRSHYL